MYAAYSSLVWNQGALGNTAASETKQAAAREQRIPCMDVLLQPAFHKSGGFEQLTSCSGTRVWNPRKQP
jgi:hypothetical protein